MNTKITLVVAAIGLAAAGYSSSTTISANAAASNKTGSELKYKQEEGILLPINYILHEFNYILHTN
jgi:hypothetical protein